MIRLLIELILVVALAGAGFFAWKGQQSGKANEAKLTEQTTQLEAATKAAEAAKTELEAANEAKKKLEPLATSAQQLEAIKASFASGETLHDLEELYKPNKKDKNPKKLSVERQLGLSAVRLLTKGPEDEEAAVEFKKVLDLADWGSKQKVICAAQNALAAMGQKEDVLSECKIPGLTGPSEGESKSGGKVHEKDGKKKVSWSYSGETGPDSWGEKYKTCAKAKWQSPINIVGPFVKAKLSLVPAYQEAKMVLSNDGRNIDIKVEEGGKIRVDSAPFELTKVQFHRPSEDKIDGQASAMDMKLMHRNEKGEWVTLVVLFKEGEENATLKNLWEKLPAKEGERVELEENKINFKSLLPSALDYYQYEGTLTTPPCSEGVKYYVLKTPLTVSKDQLKQFPFEGNVRPVQKLNGRVVQG